MKKNSNTQVSDYYDQKALSYGIHKTRLLKTLELLDNPYGKKILDIGCATGYLGKELKKNNYVVGVDISELAIRKAKNNLDKAYALNIETDNLKTKEKFDYIILSEIIEHFFRPHETLRKILKYLKPNGRMLISTPNFLYWGNRLQFLKGSFEYQKQGMFDEGHIHFFTYHSLKSFVQGLDCQIAGENHLCAGFISKLLVSSYPNLFAYHLIVLIQKNATNH